MKNTKKITLYINELRLEKWNLMAQKTDNTLKELITEAMKEYQQKHFSVIEKQIRKEIIPVLENQEKYRNIEEEESQIQSEEVEELPDETEQTPEEIKNKEKMKQDYIKFLKEKKAKEEQMKKSKK